MDEQDTISVASFFQQKLNTAVRLILNDGRKIKGTLIQLDGHLNIAIKDACFIDESSSPLDSGKLFIVRGNNIAMVQAAG